MRPSPPWLVRAVLRRLVGREPSADLLYDLDERFSAVAASSGPTVARAWYRRQLWRYLRESLARPRPGLILTHSHSDERMFPMTGLRQDVRFAFRSLRRSPGFAASTLSILMLGIGGTTAVFSVLHGILLRPLPYAEPGRLIVPWTINQRQNIPDGSSQYNTRDWLERSRTLEDLALYTRPEFTTVTIDGFGEVERVHVGLVTYNFFDVLGVGALQGRTFEAADLDRDPRLVVVNEAYWRQKYAGSSEAIGSTIDVFGEPRRVVGVVSSDVRLPRATTMLWVLEDVYATDPHRYSRGNDSYVVLARLKPQATVAQAQSELTTIAAQLAAEYPETNRYLGVEVRPLITEITGERLPFFLWTLFAAVVLVLIVAATNVAHLVLARGTRRRRELALRTALGASRVRIVRQLVVETGLLGIVATLGGIVLGAVMLRVFKGLIPPDIPRLSDVRLDGTVLALAVGATALIAPVFGLLPSLRNARQDPADTLRAGGRGVSGSHRGLRRLLVTVEVAVAVVLLAEAGLLLRSARAVGAVDPGFDARSILVAQVDLAGLYTEPEDIHQFIETVTRRVRALPEVTGVGVIDDFFVRRYPDMSISVEGQPAFDPEDQPRLTADFVHPGFFDATGLSMVAGREFTEADMGDPDVVVINLVAAETFWPNTSPIGKRFWFGHQSHDSPGVEVVGVVSDFRRGALEEEAYPNLFFANVNAGMDLAVRSSRDPVQLAAALRDVVRETDPKVPVSRVGTAWEHFGVSMAERRLQSWLLSAFSLFAVLLAGVGLYGLLYDAVNVRRREIGIRIALGAAPSTVRRLVLLEGLALATVGLLVGLVGAMAASRLTSSLLYEVSPIDPATLGAVVLGLLGVAGLSSWLPARRATLVHPIETLTAE